ncbi:MAG: transposase, partial [Methylovulum sp.]|nr:transposase [Methylovulum sp.]
MAETLGPLAAFMHSRCVKSDGIVFVDSTPLCVCENIRIPRHKTFAGVAGRGELVSFCLTRGNVDDRKPVPTLANILIGKLFGDRGCISKKLT